MGTQTIYWAAFNQDPTPDSLKLRSLVRDIATTQNNHVGRNHVACPAIRSKHANTFYGVFPYDLEVSFSGQMITNRPDEVEQRDGLYENSFAFNWRYNRIFFSPVPQMMETSPAFLHQTSYTQYGHAPSGGFDIGRWFRPSAPSFQLWSGITQFKALKDEPHLYFNFPNKDVIQLRQFKMTNSLYDISFASVAHKEIVSKENLQSLYNRFTRSGLNKKIMREIEANLL